MSLLGRQVFYPQYTIQGDTPSMLFQTDRQSFIREFDVASAFADRKSFHDSVVELKAVEGDGVYLSARGLTSEVCLKSKADMKGAGLDGKPSRALVRPWLLKQVLTVAESDTLEIVRPTPEHASIEVSTPGDAWNSLWTLMLPDVNSFKEVPQFDSTKYFIVKAGELRQAINDVWFCADRVGSAKYALSTVRMEFRGDALKLMATDGRMLGLSTLKTIKMASPADCDFMIPLESVQSLMAALRNPEANVQLAVESGRLQCRADACTIRITEQAGRYPGIELFEREENYRSATIVFNIGPFARAMSQLVSMTDADESAVCLTKDNGNTIRAQCGKSFIDIPCDNNVSTVRCHMDIRRIIQFCKSIRDPEITIEWAPPVNEGSTHKFSYGGTRFFIMPMARE